MGRSTWSGPMQSGVRTGATASTTIGNVTLTQEATVAGNSSGATNIVIPANAVITGISMAVVCAASAATSIAAQGVNFRVGRVAGNDAWFGTVKVSGIGNYIVGADLNPNTQASVANWLGAAVTANTQVFVDATAVTSVSALSNMGARLRISYFQQ